MIKIENNDVTLMYIDIVWELFTVLDPNGRQAQDLFIELDELFELNVDGYVTDEELKTRIIQIAYELTQLSYQEGINENRRVSHH